MEITVMSVLVDDQDKALDFYTNKLGFLKKNEIPLGEHKWLTVVGPQNPDGVEISLEPTQNPAVANELEAFRSAMMANGIPWTSFGCDDVDAEHKRLTELGVHFTQKPMRVGNVTIAVFDDTCGNLIQIAQMHEA